MTVKKNQLVFFSHPRVPFLLLCLLLVFFAGLSIFFYFQYQKAQGLLKSQTVLAQEEIKTVVSHVKTLMFLPVDEEPSLATVTDITKLRKEAVTDSLKLFLKDAANGDKILIYQNAKKNILYRPSVNRIVDIYYGILIQSTQKKEGITPTPMPVSISPTVSITLTPTPTVATPIKITIYNGTKIVGLAGKTETQIKEKFPDVEFTSTANSKNDYSKTIIIDLKGTNKDMTIKIAGLLGGRVVAFPQGESMPDADILVIVGE